MWQVGIERNDKPAYMQAGFKHYWNRSLRSESGLTHHHKLCCDHQMQLGVFLHTSLTTNASSKFNAIKWSDTPSRGKLEENIGVTITSSCRSHNAFCSALNFAEKYRQQPNLQSDRVIMDGDGQLAIVPSDKNDGSKNGCATLAPAWRRDGQEFSSQSLVKEREQQMGIRRAETRSQHHKTIWTKMAHGGPYRKVQYQILACKIIHSLRDWISCRFYAYIASIWWMEPFLWSPVSHWHAHLAHSQDTIFAESNYIHISFMRHSVYVIALYMWLWFLLPARLSHLHSIVPIIHGSWLLGPPCKLDLNLACWKSTSILLSSMKLHLDVQGWGAAVHSFFSLGTTLSLIAQNGSGAGNTSIFLVNSMTWQSEDWPISQILLTECNVFFLYTSYRCFRCQHSNADLQFSARFRALHDCMISCRSKRVADMCSAILHQCPPRRSSWDMLNQRRANLRPILWATTWHRQVSIV